MQKYLYYRAAEITQQHGYRYFVILATDLHDKKSEISTPTTVSSSAFSSGSGNYSGNTFHYGNQSATNGNLDYSGFSHRNTTISPGQIYHIHKYNQKILIRLLHSNKGIKYAINAKMILSEIKVNKFNQRKG